MMTVVTPLDDLPDVESLFGIDLKSGSMIVAALGIVHPIAYGCSCCIKVNNLIVTMWILVALYFALSFVLMVGIVKNNPVLIIVWSWYCAVFICFMVMICILLAMVYASRHQKSRAVVAMLALIYYILSVYFLLVVNSHRKSIVSKHSEFDF